MPLYRAAMQIVTDSNMSYVQSKLQSYEEKNKATLGMAASLLTVITNEEKEEETTTQRHT